MLFIFPLFRKISFLRAHLRKVVYGAKLNVSDRIKVLRYVFFDLVACSTFLQLVVPYVIVTCTFVN